MPRREARFDVTATPGELWKFIRDFRSLCTCIPGVEQIRLVDDRTAELTVKEKIGVVPLIVNLTAKIESEESPHRLHATARAEHLTMSIDVTLQAIESGTGMVALFDVKGEGQLKPIVDRLFERRATERAAQFAECLRQRFGAVSPEGAEARIRADAEAAQHWFGRLGGWFNRLWLRIMGMQPGKRSNDKQS